MNVCKTQNKKIFFYTTTLLHHSPLFLHYTPLFLHHIPLFLNHIPLFLCYIQTNSIISLTTLKIILWDTLQSILILFPTYIQ